MTQRNNMIYVARVLLCLICIIYYQPAFCANNYIVIHCDKNLGNINKKVFGNNIIAYDPMTYEDWANEFYGYSDYGAGIWDPKWDNPLEEVIKLGRKAGISVLRFPGGCGAHHYNWKNVIGKDRKHFLYGIDEFLETCKVMGAEPIITVSYFTGNEQDAADLVEYLKSADDGKHKWAAKRTKNGNRQPFGVKYYEIGNEDWHGDHQTIKSVLPEEYANRYLKYYFAMKSVDPSIQIGAILHTSEWNKKVLEIIKDKIDFGIIHIYPSPGVDKETLERMDANDIFSISLAMPVVSNEYCLREAAILLKEKSGKDVPLAVTEYNGGFVQDKPVPYRHCLGTALLNADLLRIFMNPENNVFMANYWNYNNSYTGMISNGFADNPKDLYKPYYKRPNYCVFELYAKHFGEILIEANVKCDSYDVKPYMSSIKSFAKRAMSGALSSQNLLESKWAICPFIGTKTIEKSRVLEIDFKKPQTFNYYNAIKKARVEPNTFYKFSGYIKTQDLVDNVGVCLEVQDSRGWVATHSAERTEEISGTNDWKYVEGIYETLPDAVSVMLIARRNGSDGPLHGKAYFKEVRLEKFVPNSDSIHVPYLSVNASKSNDGDRIYLMVVNKNMDKGVAAVIDIKDFIQSDIINVWVMNGPGVDATNERKHDNVKVTHHELNVKGNSFEFTFEPHSLTAIEIQRERI